MNFVTKETVLNLFARHTGTDVAYLQEHVDRFVNTYHRFDSSWDRDRGVRVLDLGAHWLHQAATFSLGGYRVVAADLPLTLSLDPVRKLAEELGIRLVAYDDLSVPDSLAAIESDSMNVIVMAEIVEHITFNPVSLWKEVYRVLAPGGRIVVTTPNFYRAGGRAWEWKRFLQGFGSGISTIEIVSTMTMGHHWKEYSMRELQHYFCMLSPDFNCVKSEYTTDKVTKTAALERRLKWLRQGIHLEIEVARKEAGIGITPGW